jgi:hypothetical protein
VKANTQTSEKPTTDNPIRKYMIYMVRENQIISELIDKVGCTMCTDVKEKCTGCTLWRRLGREKLQLLLFLKTTLEIGEYTICISHVIQG